MNDFAIPRMPEGAAHPVTTKQEAERRWEPLFIGEIMAGRDPRAVPLRQRRSSDASTVSGFLDLFVDRYVTPQGLRSAASIRSRIKVLKANLGDLPLSAIEQPEPINRFKTESEYADDVELASVHRALEVLRTAINWGRAQTPPLIIQSPFHRFGVTMNTKDEASRDRRLQATEEKALLDTALARMNTPEHQNVGPLLHDRIIGAIELCCRRGEMLLIQNRRVDRERHQIAIPAPRRRIGRTGAYPSTRTAASLPSCAAVKSSGRRHTSSARNRANTRRTSRRLGRLFAWSRTAASRGAAAMA